MNQPAEKRSQEHTSSIEAAIKPEASKSQHSHNETPSEPVKKKLQQGLSKGAKAIGRGLKVVLKKTLLHGTKGTGMAIAAPFRAVPKGKKIIEEQVVDKIADKLIEKGWKKPSLDLKPLSYPQKAFLYRKCHSICQFVDVRYHRLGVFIYRFAGVAQ